MAKERREILDELDKEFFVFIWRVKENAARAFKPLGIRAEQGFVLELIDRGLHHPKEIAEAIHWDPPLLSHYLSKLEERGLIERRLDPDDRRRTKIFLSQKGRRLLGRAREGWRKHAEHALSLLKDEELRVLRDFLQRILRTQEGEG